MNDKHEAAVQDGRIEKVLSDYIAHIEGPDSPLGSGNANGEKKRWAKFGATGVCLDLRRSAPAKDVAGPMKRLRDYVHGEIVTNILNGHTEIVTNILNGHTEIVTNILNGHTDIASALEPVRNMIDRFPAPQPKGLTVERVKDILIVRRKHFETLRQKPTTDDEIKAEAKRHIRTIDGIERELIAELTPTTEGE